MGRQSEWQAKRTSKGRGSNLGRKEVVQLLLQVSGFFLVCPPLREAFGVQNAPHRRQARCRQRRGIKCAHDVAAHRDVTPTNEHLLKPVQVMRAGDLWPFRCGFKMTLPTE